MAEILDGPPSIRDRVVEQAEYIRLLEEKLAEAKAEVERLRLVIEATAQAQEAIGWPDAARDLRAALRGEGEK